MPRRARRRRARDHRLRVAEPRRERPARFARGNDLPRLGDARQNGRDDEGSEPRPEPIFVDAHPKLVRRHAVPLSVPNRAVSMGDVSRERTSPNMGVGNVVPNPGNCPIIDPSSASGKTDEVGFT